MHVSLSLLFLSPFSFFLFLSLSLSPLLSIYIYICVCVCVFLFICCYVTDQIFISFFIFPIIILPVSSSLSLQSTPPLPLLLLISPGFRLHAFHSKQSLPIIPVQQDLALLILHPRHAQSHHCRCDRLQMACALSYYCCSRGKCKARPGSDRSKSVRNTGMRWRNGPVQRADFVPSIAVWPVLSCEVKSFQREEWLFIINQDVICLFRKTVLIVTLISILVLLDEVGAGRGGFFSPLLSLKQQYL